MKQHLAYIFFALLAIEGFGYLLSAMNIEPSGFRLFVSNEWNDDTNPYADRDSIVGVWHKPNDEWIQNGPCFTINMHANQYGARDNSWDTTKSGYLFLGSSLIEGYGVNYGKRISEVFETITHKEVFNCAMAGSFTPVQYYKTLDKFSHTLSFDTCFVFIILPNDEYHISKPEKGRYRPYLSDTGIYYVKTVAYFPERKSRKEKLQLFIQQYSYLYHLYYYFQNRNILKSRAVMNDEAMPDEPYPQVTRIMNLFCTAYPDKFFYFVITPTLNSSAPALPQVNHPNMHIIDLRKTLQLSTDYFNCNEHWNSSGHYKTAVALYDSVFNKAYRP